MVDREMGPSLERVEATSGVGGSRGMLATTGLRVAMVALVAVVTGANGMAGLMLTFDDIIKPPGASGTAPNPSESKIIEHINRNDEYGALNGDLGVLDLGELLFKWERDSNAVDSSRPLASSYDLVDLIGDGKKGGTVRYLGSGDFVDPLLPSWLLVKNGNAGWVVYDLDDTGSFGVNWDGTEDITFTNAGLFHQKGKGKLKDISNIQIWGSKIEPVVSPPPTGAVPEPSSLAIWGVCLGALGLVIRRRMAAVAV